MKLIFFTLLFFSFTSYIFAQNNPIDIIVEHNDNKTLDFSFRKYEPGSYTLYIHFDKLENSQYYPREISLTSNAGSLFTLRPQNSDVGINYSYRYRYISGICNPRELDSAFVYLLPYAPNSEVRILEASYVGKTYLNHKEPKGWKSYYFEGKELDSVFAVRKGIVTKVIDENDFNQDVSFTTERNSIRIEHPDGSTATYTGFAKGKIVVKKGDEVLPHTFLGSLKNDHEMGNDMLSLSMSFLSNTGFKEGGKAEYTMFAPVFYTLEGATKLVHGKQYIVAATDEIITKEMTRKEKRRYRK
ncbi:MAG: hypothetical protein Q4G63_09165 [Bacteroidia bacterium]|nr:hypothetical protein [Bacteroidia bacterium]